MRFFLKYDLTSLKVSKSSFIQFDNFKIWNSKFVEQRKEYFKNWPIPLETFKSDKPNPRYYFKPNLKMKRTRCKMKYGLEFCLYTKAELNEDIYWSSNKYGFRGKDFEINKPKNTIRIVALGASTTEGQFADRQTYPFYLEETLQSQGYNVEVINGGRHGQGVDDHLEFFRQKILPLKPDLLIFYEAANDLYPGEWLDNWTGWNKWYKSYPKIIEFLFEHSAVVNELTDRFSLPWHKPYIKKHNLLTDTPKPNLENYINKITEIVELSKENNIIPVLITFVTVINKDLQVDKKEKTFLWRDIYMKWYPFTLEEIDYMYSRYNNSLKQIAEKEKVNLFDLGRLYPKEQKYFFDHVHFTPEGNQLVAEYIADFLKTEILMKNKNLEKN